MIFASSSRRSDCDMDSDISVNSATMFARIAASDAATCSSGSYRLRTAVRRALLRSFDETAKPPRGNRAAIGSRQLDAGFGMARAALNSNGQRFLQVTSHEGRLGA
jgi:hypothetical protein